MRLMHGIAIVLLAACPVALGAVTGGSIAITSKLDAAGRPVDALETIAYPAFTEAQVRVTGLTPGRSTAPPRVPAPRSASAAVTPSISRNLKAREPLDALGLSGSGVFFHVEARGLTPGHNHQIRIDVRDGKGGIVTVGHFGHVPRQPDEPIWFPVVPATSHAPGQWTFLMQVDGRDLARVALEARSGDHKVRAQESPLQPAWPLLVVALLVLPLVIGYQLWALRSAKAPVMAPQAAPGTPAGMLDPALLALIAANLMPLGFVAYGLTSAGEVLVLYWVENLMVAFYAVLRIASARGDAAATLAQRAALIAFFLVHFGAFCAAHGSLIYQVALSKSDLLALDPRTFLDARLHAAFAPRSPWQGVPVAFALQAVALLVSHGVSFIRNYLQRGEVYTATPAQEMTRPYRRLFPLHLATIVGGFFAVSLPSAVVILVFLVLIKTSGDAWLHFRSHAS